MRSLFAIVLLAVTPALLAATSAEVTGDHLSVALLSEQDALVPGHAAWFGLRLRHDAHWHTYWMNPGDSGLPTKLAWQLPEGFQSGAITWPVPKRFTLGELYNFGYDGEALLPVRIDVPANAAPGSSAHLAVQAKWLVCREECIPGKADLTLDLPVRAAGAPDSQVAALFAHARESVPKAGAWKGNAQLIGDHIEVRVRGANLGSGEGLDAYAENTKVVANAPPRVERRGDGVVLTFAKSDYFTSIPKSLDLVLQPRNAPALRAQAFFPAGP